MGYRKQVIKKKKKVRAGPYILAWIFFFLCHIATIGTDSSSVDHKAPASTSAIIIYT